MADNVTSNPGAGGYVFATDEVGGAHHPYSKIEYGADGEAIPVSTTNPLPVADSAADNLLFRILQILLAPLGYDKSLQRYRQTAIIESGTVTTCATLTNQTNIGGFNADAQVRANINAAWNLNVRARIT